MKEVERIARVYYRDYADEYDLLETWHDLSLERKRQWLEYAQRRLDRDS